MNEVQTVLARRIFDRAVSKAQDVVFLYTPKDKPLALTFGPNYINTASYFIHLSFDGTELEISSEDPQQFFFFHDVLLCREGRFPEKGHESAKKKGPLVPIGKTAPI